VPHVIEVCKLVKDELTEPIFGGSYTLLLIRHGLPTCFQFVLSQALRQSLGKKILTQRKAHRGYFIYALFPFDLLIKLGETSSLLCGSLQLVATLRDSALDVLPCRGVHCVGVGEGPSIDVEKRKRRTNRRDRRRCAQGARRASDSAGVAARIASG